MARKRGRKSKGIHVRRTKNGTLAQEELRPETVRLVLKRLISLIPDPYSTEAGSFLGRMLLSREIDQALYDAGVKYRERRHAYESAIEARRARSAVFEPSFGSSYDADTDRGREQAEKEEHDVKQYDALTDSLRPWGIKVKEALDTVCIDNEYVDWAMRHNLKIGLRVLAVRLGYMRKGQLD